MKKLTYLLNHIQHTEVIGKTAISINSLSSDSREKHKQSIFVARKGSTLNGNDFINEAISNGAKVIIFDSMNLIYNPKITYIKVKDSEIALAELANSFYDFPSTKLKLVGVTGTNGKTTTATLLYKLFRLLGYRTALISTIENRINEKVFKATHTTPDAIKLQEFLSMAVSKKCKYAFMECSSHALDQKRVHGLKFAGAVFTNFTQDHLDYHKTLRKYAEAKKILFDMLPSSAFALGNIDDLQSKFLLKNTKAKKYFFGIKSKKSDFKGRIVHQSPEGTSILIDKVSIQTKLLGEFNVYNILAIFATAKLLGISQNKILSRILLLTPPKGRLEFTKSKSNVYGVVDYAHTPDALENVLKTLIEIVGPKNKIITIVGCGGDRDVLKRPIMGGIACKMSDKVIFTSDNPRNENPESILEDMTSKFPQKIKNYEKISDRKKAIIHGIRYAEPNDIVLVAGKGHEDYQIFKERTIHFSDMEVLKKYLN